MQRSIRTTPNRNPEPCPRLPMCAEPDPVKVWCSWHLQRRPSFSSGLGRVSHAARRRIKGAPPGRVVRPRTTSAPRGPSARPCAQARARPPCCPAAAGSQARRTRAGAARAPPPGAPCTRRASATHRSPPSWRRSGCAWPSPRPAPWRAPRRTARAPALCTSRLARACLLLTFSLLACRVHCSSARRAATAEPTCRALHRAGSCRGGAPRRQQQRARRAAPPPQVRACWEVRTRLQQGSRCGCTPSACRDPQRTSISRVCVCVCVACSSPRGARRPPPGTELRRRRARCQLAALHLTDRPTDRPTARALCVLRMRMRRCVRRVCARLHTARGRLSLPRRAGRAGAPRRSLGAIANGRHHVVTSFAAWRIA